jgi:putative tryptophan/tyrosine transport system substrate-binding protein
MRRRAFIAALGGAAAWPFMAHAQQPAMPVIGFLSSGAPEGFANFVPDFRLGLKGPGFTEGRNVTIEYGWAENQYDRLPALVAELIGLRVAVIAATGGPVSGLAVKAATKTLPFVFVSGIDPVKLGLVTSLNRLGSNAMGVNILVTAVEAKRLGLLHELLPTAKVISYLINRNSPEGEIQVSDVEAAARALGQQVFVLKVGSEQEIDAAFATIAENGATALLVGADPFFNNRRRRIVALAARYQIPAIYEGRGFAVDGGLMSYGPSIGEVYRQVGEYTGLILKGANPADLPVVQPTKLELVINLKTAKALGLEIPPQLLARADEVIE